MTEDPTEIRPVTLAVSYRFRLWVLVLSVLGFGPRTTWTRGVWQIWATTPDGRRFLLKKFYDEDDARRAAEAFERQLTTEDPVRWARSKGSALLAAHLEELGRER